MTSTVSPAAHESTVARVARDYQALPSGQPVRLAKRTSNLFRLRPAAPSSGLDVSGLDGVVSLDTDRGLARVQGMTTYEAAVEALLPHGFMPMVVPQLKTITLGGAVTGLGIESSSFRNGLPHESVTELEILTGAGDVVRARADNEYADLFHAFPNSYGSLGYALSLTIELERVQPFVLLRHVRFGTLREAIAAIETIMTTRAWDGEPVDFLDGVVFSATETYLTLGRWADDPSRDGHQGRPSDYSGQQIYYRSLQERHTDVLTVHDYLWRWDTDWFWCSRVFGVQNPLVRRFWPRRYQRSDVYSKLVALDAKYGLSGFVDARRGRPERERVIQDVEIPVERTAEFVEWFLAEVPIEPIWLCPLQLRRSGDGNTETSPPWPLYPLRPGERYVNVGFWSTVPVEPGRRNGDVNRRIEAKVSELGGHKSLYSDSYYDQATFAALYGGEAYQPIKDRYDPAGRLPTLYEKAVHTR